MSIFDSLKSSKKPIAIITAIAGAVVITLILFMTRGEKNNKPAGNEVISRRIKIDMTPSGTTAPGEPASSKETANKLPLAATPPAAAPAIKNTGTAQAPVAAPLKPVSPEAKPAETKPAAAAVKAALKPEKTAKKELEEAKTTPKKTSGKELARAKHGPARKQPAKAVASGATARTKHAVRAKEVVEKPWAVNVASYPNQKDAEAFRDSLKSAGYSAYITEFDKSGVTWHRVRVGFYRTQTDAKNAGKDIKQKMKLHQDPWIVRPFSQDAKGK